jgi:23S rRNA (cytosine1962-C5)-methyltransferase
MPETAASLPPLRLKPREDRRLKAGHLWIYSNEVDTAATPLTGFEAGQAVEVQADNGKAVGTGYVNPHSLICARLLSRDQAHPIGPSLLVHRVKVALALRERIFDTPHYRLVHGEADGLPGLIVDRYGKVLVVQMGTAGMERMREDIVAALDKVLRPAGILLRNDAAIRELEGLPRYVELASGQVPEEVELSENGVRFRASPHSGQKTGWYYDHRDNRARLARYVRGRTVLDLFAYLGGWGVQAAAFGAERVLCVDASPTAVEGIGANAALNGVGERVEAVQGDVFEMLKALRAERARFDVVIADPPAFIKRRKDLKTGLAAYRRLNQMAVQVLERDGLLVSSSCSFHLEADALRGVVQHAARHLDRGAALLEQGHQAPDHPIHPAIPETEYLKALTLRILPA